MPQLRIIAKYRNGKMLKGTTSNFWPNSPSFHVAPVEAPSGTPPQMVSVNDLKALFVVRDFQGDSHHVKQQRFHPGETVQGQRLEVVFKDGETLEGSTLEYDPAAPGFFLFPADCTGNNERIYVVNSYVRSVRRL